MILENDIVRLRAVEPDDLDFIYALETSEGAAENGFTTAPPSRHLLWEYIQNYSADIYVDRQLRLIIEDVSTDQTAGAIDIADFEPRDRRGFVGIVISPTLRRRGLALAALKLLCRYAADTIGMHQLAAVVAIDNEASRHLFTSAGFKPAGRLRSWVRRGNQYTDALIFQHLFN